MESTQALLFVISTLESPGTVDGCHGAHLDGIQVQPANRDQRP